MEVMPRIKSAKKALRQNVRRRALNLSRQRKIKDVIVKFRKFTEAGKLEEAKTLLPQIYKTLDKVAKTGYLKKGKADRLKSRLTKKLAKQNQ
jgi:small subunit ribosomal protein S20